MQWNNTFLASVYIVSFQDMTYIDAGTLKSVIYLLKKLVLLIWLDYLYLFVFIHYRQQVYENPIIDWVETIKPINRHSTHTDHIKAKSLGYGGYHTELINIATHFWKAHRLPNKSALGTLAYSKLAWRGKRHNIPFLIVSTRAMGTCKIGRERVALAETARPNMSRISAESKRPENTPCRNMKSCLANLSEMRRTWKCLRRCA